MEHARAPEERAWSRGYPAIASVPSACSAQSYLARAPLAIALVLEEESQHLAARVRACGVGVGALRAAAGPRMRGAVHGPLLEPTLPGSIEIADARVLPAAGAAVLNAPFERRTGARR